MICLLFHSQVMVKEEHQKFLLLSLNVQHSDPPSWVRTQCVKLCASRMIPSQSTSQWKLRTAGRQYRQTDRTTTGKPRSQQNLGLNSPVCSNWKNTLCMCKIKVSLVLLTPLEMKQPEQIHAMENAVTESDQLWFPFKHPYEQNDHLRLSLAWLCTIYNLVIPAAFQSELEI